VPLKFKLLMDNAQVAQPIRDQMQTRESVFQTYAEQDSIYLRRVLAKSALNTPEENQHLRDFQLTSVDQISATLDKELCQMELVITAQLGQEGKVMERNVEQTLAKLTKS